MADDLSNVLWCPICWVPVCLRLNCAAIRPALLARMQATTLFNSLYFPLNLKSEMSWNSIFISNLTPLKLSSKVAAFFSLLLAHPLSQAHMASRSSRIKVPQDFWSQFGDFVPNPQAGLEMEFKRLARHQGWQPNSTGWREYRAQAYIYEIQSHYGNDSTKLECWQILCKQVGIYPEPQSISKCKEVSFPGHLLSYLLRTSRLSSTHTSISWT